MVALVCSKNKYFNENGHSYQKKSNKETSSKYFKLRNKLNEATLLDL